MSVTGALREEMSGPSRQRSLRERLKDGIASSWPRRRSSQGSNSSKGVKPYFIPTGLKAKTAEGGHGYVNPMECDWGTNQAKRTFAEEMSDAKVVNDSGDDSPVLGLNLERERRQTSSRVVSQPKGTIQYTVSASDTLAGMAARFDTTPSELVKINRLVSRLIFPGQTLYVPDKSTPKMNTPKSSDEINANKLPAESTKFHLEASVGIESPDSPKPGHAERVQTPPSSPPSNATPAVSRLSEDEDEDKKLDKECIERFLKINAKHITDGQGVVSGVLLVTPNAVMFDPSVIDILVKEHGADKYGVIAPMDYVVNAALYKDIAHMRVKHAPRNNEPQPEVYHVQSCPLYKAIPGEESSTDPENPLADAAVLQPSRSESQQAVSGSVSDKADLELSEDGETSSICSCSVGNKGSNVESPEEHSSASEVFTTSATPATILSDLENGEKTPEVDVQKIDLTDGPKESEDTGTSVQGMDDGFGENEKVGSQNGRVTSLEGNFVESKISNRPCVLPFLEALAAEDVLIEAEPTTRKHSIPEAQLSQESARLKVLKRLSYPLSWMESFGGGSTDKESLSVPAVDPSVGSSPERPDTALTTLSKILTSASPRNLVDFSSGLFTRSTDDVGKIQDLTDGALKSQNFEESGALQELAKANRKHLSKLGRRGSTPEGGFTEALNPILSRHWRSSEEGKAHQGVKDNALRVEFKSEVTFEDKKSLFVSMDTLGSNFEEFELIPRPAKASEDSPLYLCLRMGKPLGKNLPKCTAVMSYGRQRIKREYWFSIPRDRVDGLYNFFQQWAPGVYGDINLEELKCKGYELISSDEDLSDVEDAANTDKERNKDGRKSKSSTGSNNGNSVSGDKAGTDYPADWEIIKAPYMKLIGRLRRDTQSADSEVRYHRQRSHSFPFFRTTLPTIVVSISDAPDIEPCSLDMELPLPELIGDTEILDVEHRRMLSKRLPARAEGYSWNLIFSTSQHGFSLQTMYRKMAQYDTPVLMVVQDTENNVFGALTSCTVKASDHFYGTGESFLFTFCPEFKHFTWTGENVYFIKGNPESLAIGAGDGLFGLWLDGDLYHGRSHPCKTYNNDTLSLREDFFVKTLEAWGFVEFGTEITIPYGPSQIGLIQAVLQDEV